MPIDPPSARLTGVESLRPLWDHIKKLLKYGGSVLCTSFYWYENPDKMPALHFFIRIRSFGISESGLLFLAMKYKQMTTFSKLLTFFSPAIKIDLIIKIDSVYNFSFGPFLCLLCWRYFPCFWKLPAIKGPANPSEIFDDQSLRLGNKMREFYFAIFFSGSYKSRGIWSN